MLTLRGPSALSAARSKKLLARINKITKSTSLIGQYIHFIDSPKLSRKQQRILNEILDYGQPITKTPTGQLFLVVPRPGTISPWSTKATDILHNCGLSQVRRLEYGIAYHLKGSTKLTTKSYQTISKLLHDRMTQSVLPRLSDAKILFAASNPQPASSIDVLGHGRRELAKANEEYGLALSDSEIDYLVNSFRDLKRK